jgi:hypothetical protein
VLFFAQWLNQCKFSLQHNTNILGADTSDVRGEDRWFIKKREGREVREHPRNCMRCVGVILRHRVRVRARGPALRWPAAWTL